MRFFFLAYNSDDYIWEFVLHSAMSTKQHTQHTYVILSMIYVETLSREKLKKNKTKISRVGFVIGDGISYLENSIYEVVLYCVRLRGCFYTKTQIT